MSNKEWSYVTGIIFGITGIITSTYDLTLAGLNFIVFAIFFLKGGLENISEKWEKIIKQQE
jgi:hypothetical protein